MSKSGSSESIGQYSIILCSAVRIGGEPNINKPFSYHSL